MYYVYIILVENCLYITRYILPWLKRTFVYLINVAFNSSIKASFDITSFCREYYLSANKRNNSSISNISKFNEINEFPRITNNFDNYSHLYLSYIVERKKLKITECNPMCPSYSIFHTAIKTPNTQQSKIWGVRHNGRKSAKRKLVEIKCATLYTPSSTQRQKGRNDRKSSSARGVHLKIKYFSWADENTCMGRLCVCVCVFFTVPRCL